MLAEIAEIPSVIYWRRAREPTASIFQDRGVDPGPMDRTTDVPGSRNRIATDPGKVRGVRQTARPERTKTRFIRSSLGGITYTTRTTCVRATTRTTRKRKKKERAGGRGQSEKEAARETKLGKHHRGV